jgi:DNA polymerase-1
MTNKNNSAKANQDKTLVLVDGSALAFRSFYALMRQGFRRKDGTPTWAVYGFFNALFELLQADKPEMMAVCFDLKDPTFRHIEYAEYKANRDEMPDDLATQWPMIKEGVKAFDIPLYELAGYEADDVIGTVATQAAEAGIKVQILTGDQDAFQLLGENIEVLMPSSQGGLKKYEREQVFEKLGVWPEQVIDYKALCGDTSDNIPGVKGIGPKTASQLLSKWNTLENIYNHLDEVESKSVCKKLTEGKESAFASQRLATIVRTVPLDFDFAHCHLTMPKLSEVVQFLQKLEFKRMLTQLPQVLKPFNDGADLEANQQADLTALIGGAAAPLDLTNKQNQASDLRPTTDTTQEAPQGQLTLANLVPSTFAPPSPEIIDTEDKLDQLVTKLRKQSVVCVDLETTSVASLECEIVGYALAWSDNAKMTGDKHLQIEDQGWQQYQAYIPVKHFGAKQLPPDVVAARLKPILEDPNIGKIAQNAKYEMNVLSLLGINLAPVIFDPMLASYIQDPDNRNGLKDQSEKLLNYEMVRISELIGTGRKQMTMDQLPVDRVAPYAGDDARMTLELAKFWLTHLDEKQKYLLWDMDLPLSVVLAKMEQNGVALDLPYLSQFSKELTQALQELESDIFRLAGRPFNINSTQQLQQILFQELNLKPKGKTKSGYSTDASVLEALKEEHEIIGKLLEFRQLAKLRSTYVDSLPRQVSERDHRLHGEFNQTVTSTGRLSSTNPNLQNIPIRTEIGRRIRRAFIPEAKSTRLLSADYSQIELRLLAHMSADETLLDAFAKDQDIHARTAMEIFDLPLEAVTSDMRRVGKTINFSLIYQQGAYSTAQDLGISPREAQAFIDKYFSRYPNVDNYLKSSILEARRRGYTETLWGRRRYFRNLNDRNDNIRKAEERAACNAPLQGSAADLMKLAMIRLHLLMQERKLSAKLILQVHDELVLEVPDSELEETKVLVRQCMQLEGQANPLKVPLKVDMRVGNNWMEAK